MSYAQITGSGGSGGSGVLTLTGNSGGALPPTAGNINIVGTGGISVAGVGSTLTISDSTTTFMWSVVTTNTALTANNGYFANGVGRLTFTLPATGSIGDTITVCNMQGGWTIAQGTSQFIQFGIDTTTVGTGGSLSSTAIGNAVQMVCNVAGASTGWFVVPGSQGNITVV